MTSNAIAPMLFLLIRSVNITCVERIEPGWLSDGVLESPSDATPVVDFQHDSLPVPSSKNMLFYVQQSRNMNTIVYELNLNHNGEWNSEDPIKMYWIRYAEQAQQESLTWIQKTYAYGLKIKRLGYHYYELRFPPYKNLTFYLSESSSDSKITVHTEIENRQLIVKRIYLKITGGTLMKPAIEYVELEGMDRMTYAPLAKRLRIAK